MASNSLLSSWKEIATYLNRGVRTVQRWEKIGLPVRRVHDGPRAPVVALADDLDRWIRATRMNGTQNPRDAKRLIIHEALLDSAQQSRTLRSKSASLRQSEHEALARLLDNLASLRKSCGVFLEVAAAKRSDTGVSLDRKSA